MANSNLLSRMSTPRDLPEFSGDPMEWLLFKQAYQESTNLCKFTDKENTWRLRKCLRGAAKESVASLFISATSLERLYEQWGDRNIFRASVSSPASFQSSLPFSLENGRTTATTASRKGKLETNDNTTETSPNMQHNCVLTTYCDKENAQPFHNSLREKCFDIPSTENNILEPKMTSSSSRSSSSSSSSDSSSSSTDTGKGKPNIHLPVDEPSTSNRTGRIISQNKKNYHQSPIHSDESDVDISDSDPTYTIGRPQSRRSIHLSRSSSSSSSPDNNTLHVTDSSSKRQSRKRIRNPANWKQNIA
ncbi:putative protein TPRXL [Colias croceus]|uniref:putative protein TPRXL n=1 Tax=Colias crocea TaxID=72248 RepID=UPI001E27DAA2|nr:putative protein TPRXL [Colias croceus]